MSFRIKSLLAAPYLLLLLLSPLMYFGASASAAACAPLPTDKGTAKTAFTVTSAGTYRLWAHIYSSSSGASAFDLAIDSNCPINEVGGGTLAANAFSWVNYANGATTTPITVDLTRGPHTITVAGVNPNVSVDEILLEVSSTCTPVGDGSNCTSSTTTTINNPTSTTPNLKLPKVKLPPARLIGAAAIAGIIAIIAFWAIFYYATRQNNVFERLLVKLHARGPKPAAAPPADATAAPGAQAYPSDRPLFLTGELPPQLQPAGIPATAVTSMSGVPTSNTFLNHHRAGLFALAFGIVGGLITFAALADANGTIAISLAGAQVSGQAKLVANAQAIDGHMIQFGPGSLLSTSAGATPPRTSSPPKTQTGSHPSNPGSGTGSGSSSGSGGSSTPPGPVPAGSNCTNPSWHDSGAEATDSISDTYWVNNDAWSGSHGPQTLYVCNQSSWYAVSNQTDVNGQVETYPDTEYDVGGRNKPSTKTIPQWSSITSTFSEAYPSAGSWDAGYDLWTNNWSNETMIWNQWAGGQSYWPGQAKTAVTLGGVPYHFLKNGSELMFFRDSQIASGSVDILAAFKWEVTNGYAKSTDVPTQLEYGVEICSTNSVPETFPTTGLTFSLN